MHRRADPDPARRRPRGRPPRAAAGARVGAGHARRREVGDGAEAVRRAVSDDVDLAVLDISMPGMNGIQAAQELARLRPRLRTLILSMHNNEQYFLEALRAGASGYVLKSVADHDLIRACRAAMRGEPFVLPRHGMPLASHRRGRR